MSSDIPDLYSLYKTLYTYFENGLWAPNLDVLKENAKLYTENIICRLLHCKRKFKTQYVQFDKEIDQPNSFFGELTKGSKIIRFEITNGNDKLVSITLFTETGFYYLDNNGPKRIQKGEHEFLVNIKGEIKEKKG